MSKLSQLMGKGQVFNIGGVEMELKPLTLNEIELFSVEDGSSMEDKARVSKEMITKVLKKSIPDATQEELDNVSMEHLGELMEAIMSLHKVEGSNIEKAKELIERRKNENKTPRN